MAVDLATLGLRLTNTQAIADAKATGAAFEDMGVKGEAAQAKLAASSNPVVAAMTRQEAAARRMGLMQMKAIEMNEAMGASSVAATRGLGAFAAMQAEAAGHMGEHTLAVGRLEMAISRWLGGMVGASPVMDMLGASVLKFGIGTIETAGALLVVGGLVWAYEKMTEAARKATEETNKLIEAGEKEIKLKGFGPGGARSQQEDAANQRAGELKTQIDKLEALLPKADAMMAAQIQAKLAPLGIERQNALNTAAGLHSLVTSDTTDPALKAQNDERLAALAKEDAAFQKQISTLEKGLVFDDKRKAVTAELIGIEHLLEAQVNSGTLALEKRIVANERLALVQDALAKQFITSVPITDVMQLIGLIGEGRQRGRDLTGATSDARFAAAYGGPMKDVKYQSDSNGFIHQPGQPDLIGEQVKANIKAMEAADKNTKKMVDAMWGAAMQSATIIVSSLNIGGGGKGSGLGGALGQSAGSAAGYFFGGQVGADIGSTIGSVVGSFIGGLFDSGAAAKAAAQAQKQINASLNMMADQLSHNTLAVTLDGLRMSLESQLLSINAALPGTKNQAQREADRARAQALEVQQEAQAQAQFARESQYATEDLAVRNLRATGHGPAADLLAFKDQQQREMTQAILDGKDQTYLNTLATTQNNELMAFLNGTLQDALNQVSGYRLQATIFAAMNPQSPMGPAVPLPGGFHPVNSSAGGGDLTVPISLDGAVIAKVVLKDYKSKAQRQFGDSTRWSSIQ